MNESELHEFRKIIDSNIHTAENCIINIESEHLPYGREMALARTKLQEAKMWVGQCLGKMGSELPKEFRDKHND